MFISRSLTVPESVSDCIRDRDRETKRDRDRERDRESVYVWGVFAYGYEVTS